MANSQQLTAGDGPRWAVWAQSALNGALGDFLYDERNPLAIDMALYAGKQRLHLASDTLAALQPSPSARIALLVHGLGCSESMWSWQAAEGERTSYGHMLQADFGYTPIAVRYNSGLPIAANGHRLSALLDDLAAVWPIPLDEILLIGHSMGGLVIRHACYEGSANLRPWVDHVRRVIYLGTPHEGADLERFAHKAASTLVALPNPITRLIGQLINLRSRGVQDLRHGARHDASTHISSEAAPGEPLPWLRSAEHYLIAGTLGGTESHAASVLFGDGLVRPPRGPLPMGSAAEPPPATHVAIFPGVHHVGLARSHAVYMQIRTWCAADAAQEG
jgi:pimeloyl-ACP methyl ester carboxylesterase